MKALGVLDGGDHSIHDWLDWARTADRVVAADGALHRLLEADFVPHEVIGDLDSAREDGLSRVETVIHLPNQDRGDADKLLERLHQLSDSPLVAGIEGDRLDHVLYSLQCAGAYPGTRLLMRRLFGRVLGPSRFQFTARHPLVSLLPIEPCTGVTLQGVRWELDQARMEPLGLRSLSNEAALEAEVTVTIATGTAILFTGWDGAVDWSLLA